MTRAARHSRYDGGQSPYEECYPGVPLKEPAHEGMKSHNMDISGPASATSGAQVVRRAMDVLRVVAAHSGHGASMIQVARASGLSKPTAHRLLRVLFEEAMLEYDPRSHRYRLGVEVFSLGAAMGDQFNIARVARPSLERLAERTEDVVYLSVRSGFDALCIDMCEGSFPEKAVRLHVRDRWPLGVGAFSVPLLAFLPDPEVSRIIEHNARRLGDVQEYKQMLSTEVEQARRRGYSVTRINLSPPSSAVAVPVMDVVQRPIASLCVMAVAPRMTQARRRDLAEQLKAEAAIVSGAWDGVRSVRPQSEGWWSVARWVKPVE